MPTFKVQEANIGSKSRFVIVPTPPKHGDKGKTSRIFVFIVPVVKAELAKKPLRLFVAESKVQHSVGGVTGKDDDQLS